MSSSRALIVLAVFPDNGDQYEAHIDSRLLLLWERTHNESALDLLEAPSIALMYRLAHFEAQTRRQYGDGLEAFEDSHSLNVREGAGTPDPTRTAASTGSPSLSE